MAVETVISAIIIVFVVVGAAYDVELNRKGRVLHSRNYRWRRLQNWFPMGIAYAAFYMARYDVAAGNVSSVRDTLGFSSSYMGWVLSAGSWSYAATAPFTGQITDRIGGKNGMVLACFGAALCNLSLGVLFHVKGLPKALEKVLFVVLYAGNVLVQGFGTSAVVKINAAWYSASERGIFAGVFNIMLTSGYFLSLGAGSSIITTLGWEYVFVIPGVVLLVMSFAIACWVKNTPNESTKVRFVVGSRSINNAATGETDGLSKSEQMKQLLQNNTFLGYLTAIFFLSWCRDGFLNWFLSYFDAVRSLELALTTADTAVIGGAWTIGGFVGGVLCGWLSDVLFKSDRVMPICIFSVLQSILLGSVYYFSATCSVNVLGVLVFFSSVFVLGNYTLLSYTVPSDLPQDIAAGASGIITLVAYFSTGLSGAIMGHLIQLGGYKLWAFSLMGASILTGMFTALGSYFSASTTGMMIDEAELSAAMEAMDEFTPLSSRSHSKRRASIVRLSGDFIASPMPDLSSARSQRRAFEP